MQDPHRPTAEQALPFADHVLYEIWMLDRLTARLVRFELLLGAGQPRLREPFAREGIELVGRNADIESWAVHSRVLLDFLYRDTRQRQDDILASDFFEDAMAWARGRPPKTPALISVPDRVGGEVAHLTYRRNSPAPEWDYRLIWSNMQVALRQFVEHAAENRLRPDFRRHVAPMLAQSPTQRTVESAVIVSTAALFATTLPAEYSGGTATSMPSIVVTDTSRRRAGRVANEHVRGGIRAAA